MPCLCGDTNCPSCGPAQGENPVFERVCEFLDDAIPWPDVFDGGAMSGYIAKHLADADDELRIALEEAAARHERKTPKERFGF